jgi:hypothetical protein
VINLGFDGSSDPGGRRYEAATARFVDLKSLTARTRLSAIREIKSIHESGGELRAML